MDVGGKGALLPTLVSSLILCQSVRSHPLCPDSAPCQGTLQDLYSNATDFSIRMHFSSLDIFLEFIKQYSQVPSFLIPEVKACHTASIPAPATAEEAKRTQHRDLLRVVNQYLLFWNDPLAYLAQEAQHLPKIASFFKLKEGVLLEQYRQLKELVEKITKQIDPANTGYMGLAFLTELPSGESPDERYHLLTFYNLLRCLLTDLQKIETFLGIMKDSIVGKGNSTVLPMPFVSGMAINDSSSVKII